MYKKSKIKMNLIQKVWKLLAPFHQDFYWMLAITAVFEAVRMGGPYLFGKILDLLIQSKGMLTLQSAVLVVGGLAGVRVVSLVIDYFTDIVIANLLFKAEHFVSTSAFNKLMELSLDYHERENTGNKISIINRGTDRLINLVGNYSWTFQPVVLQLVVTVTLILITSRWIGFVFSLSLIPFFLITFKTYQSTSKLRSKRHDFYEVSSGEIGDTISNITVVKAFAQEKRETDAFQNIWAQIKTLSFKEFYRHVLAGFGRNMIVEVFYTTLLILGVVEIRNGAITVGSLVFMISLIERAYSNIYRLGQLYERAVDASESVDRITNLLDRKPTIVNSSQAVKLNEIRGQVSFRHVTFAYPAKEGKRGRRVLKDVSFTIPVGSFTAIVGKSGSGKSTIAKLMSRYYDPSGGSIIIDGQYDLKDLDLDSYRGQTAVVFQDSPVPNRKIWEVIAYAAGKRNFSSVRNRIIQAAKLAHAHEFIKELPENYQTLIGERGVRLSGGQRQRLAIARAIFAEPKILIMDEPTSHLDTVSEASIQQALEEMSKSWAMTKIIIAHRLSTVQRADQILVMERGELVEKGTHKQLVAKNGIYAAIVRQSELK